MLVGRATTAHARGLGLQLFGSWCAPLRDLTALGAPLAAARAAMDSAELVRAMTEAVPAPLDIVAATEECDEAPPESGRFRAGTFSHEFETPNLEEAA